MDTSLLQKLTSEEIQKLTEYMILHEKKSDIEKLKYNFKTLKYEPQGNCRLNEIEAKDMR
jgi:hypothetical protein